MIQMRSVNLYNSVFIIILLFLNCSISAKKEMSEPALKLKQYNNIILNTITGPSLSKEKDSRPRFKDAKIIFNLQAFRKALESELMHIGFNIVEKKKNADAFVDFSFGTIKYLPSGGMIVDKAFIKFKRVKDEKIIAFFRTNNLLVIKIDFEANYVDYIISYLCKKIKRKF